MKVETRKKGQICILSVSGAVKLNQDVKLSEEFKALLDRGERRFVFDMLDVPWLDTSGITATVACQKRALDHQGEVRLVLLGKPHDLFTMYELHKVFKIYKDVEAALASFAAAVEQPVST